MNSIWFASDLHFNHDNLKLLKRTCFKDVKEMNITLINNWNEKIRKKDIVWYLGDWGFFKNIVEFEDIIGQLNGKINFIIGNHDLKKNIYRIEWLFHSVNYWKLISIERQKIFLCHFPMLSWDKMHSGSWNLYGHSHGNCSSLINQLDVSVDNCNYYPISFEEVKKIMENRNGKMRRL